MNITRRNVLLGATAAAALGPIAARAQTSEVVIGVLYPLSGASAQMGVDAQKSYETALEVINKNHDFDLPHGEGRRLARPRRRQDSSCLSPITRAIPRRAAPKPSA